MGYISIEIGGSFQSASRKGTRTGRGSKFSAMDHGHAKAVQEAIAYLADVILPVFIQLPWTENVDRLELQMPPKGQR